MAVLAEKLAENTSRIRDGILAAADRAGRDPEHVTLVAVTKTVDAATAAALVDLGIADCGENRVPSLTEKLDALAEQNIRWHFIGHLQRNKAQHVVGKVNLIHSLDSFRLAERMHRIAEELDTEQDVLLEVNVSGEEAKHGLTTGEVGEVLVQIESECPRIRVRGLMTMAPIVDDAEETRSVFRGLRELRDRLAGDQRELPELSMGMTQDYQIAIEEGATLIRVGSAFFEGL